MSYRNLKYVLLVVCSLLRMFCGGQSVTGKVRTLPVAKAWAGNSINTVIFRKNALFTDRGEQFIAFYDTAGRVVLGKRKIKSPSWQLHTTAFHGNIHDAHNSISIAVDGKGYLHLAWDHHNNALRYARSASPHSLEMVRIDSMTRKHEGKVTYPEFYRMPDGGLVFLYRDGGSGNGNLVLNRYDLKSQTWKQLQDNLIDGEGKRNAYCQTTVDPTGTIHISWVWRESPDVSSNHDLCYARSRDGGKTWERSTGKQYTLPINQQNAEYILHIPQNSELINQTSMYAGKNGRPWIAGYWCWGDSIPQYHIVYHNGKNWQHLNTNFRKTAFSLKGAGTKHIPISRPQIVAIPERKNDQFILIFRDAERVDKVSVAIYSHLGNPQKESWQIQDLTNYSVGNWEPTYDPWLWKTHKLLDLFVQYVAQPDAEGVSNIPGQMVNVVEWDPSNK